MAKKAKNAAAVALGRLGGLEGGKAREAKLSADQPSESTWLDVRSGSWRATLMEDGGREVLLVA